jgi:hypothetical protein
MVMNMREILKECCRIFIEKLTELLDQGKITKDEFEEHTKIKREFLEKI